MRAGRPAGRQAGRPAGRQAGRQSGDIGDIGLQQAVRRAMSFIIKVKSGIRPFAIIALATMAGNSVVLCIVGASDALRYNFYVISICITS